MIQILTASCSDGMDEEVARSLADELLEEFLRFASVFSDASESSRKSAKVIAKKTDTKEYENSVSHLRLVSAYY